ncbi:MBL fold metallo-hydrolase [Hymenobacter sp. BT175]|uniref:MBL fold metallo-hydrolase n=1 Tax=Hymenobacter translucens TaxID=2886507 RepID=UPI001D0F2E18|nr:MBL fold metallo-hydrolase [Hymenobacter translucens]MCC2545399.1 MBL fold metallo-hydrolase [Hymenobacter translucens]
MQLITPSLFQISLGPVNAFVVEDDGLTLIDTGYQNSLDKIFAAIRKAGRQPDDIRRIVLTHTHPDHAGSAAAIQRRLGVPIFAHAADAPLLESGVAGRLPHHLSPGLLNWVLFNAVIKRSENVVEAAPVQVKLADGDVIPGAKGMRVVHTPGHSAGHIALQVPAEGVLIVGDLCANMVGLGFSIVYEDRALGLASIRKVAALDFDQAVFGHGKPLTKNAKEKLQKAFEKYGT